MLPVTEPSWPAVPSPSCSVPPRTVVRPEYLLAPVRVRVLGPNLVSEIGCVMLFAYVKLPFVVSIPRADAVLVQVTLERRVSICALLQAVAPVPDCTARVAPLPTTIE